MFTTGFSVVNKYGEAMTCETLTAAQIAALCDHTFLLPCEAYRQEALFTFSGRISARRGVSDAATDDERIASAIAEEADAVDETPTADRKLTEKVNKAHQEGKSAIQLRRCAFDLFLEQTVALPIHPYAVCVRYSDVAYARQRLPHNIVIAATIGFPDASACSLACKMNEMATAIAEGAQEIDMVLNYNVLKAGHFDEVKREISAIANEVKDHAGVLKVILETSELTLEETAVACQIVDACGAAFVKTSTGFSSKGATVEHLRVMRGHFPRGIKISGGVNIHNLQNLLQAATTPGEPISTDPMKLRIGESSLLQKLGTGAY